ncbi:MAG: glycosyltransferase family 2 protein [Acidobacteriota bacterium]
MTSSPRVACLVLNYNGRDLTLTALASLSAMSYPSFDLVHVDNGSTDGSSEAVARAFPQVHQVRAETNRGPTHGINLGLETGLAGDYDYLLLLNNDIEVDPNMLGEMVAVAESDPAVGCVGPKAFYHGERDRLWSAGGRICFRETVTRERGMGRVDRGQFDADAEVGYVNGCAMLMRRSAVQEVGLFDTVFTLAVEDADWCMRMKKLGYSCRYAHRAVLWHMVSRTAGAYQARRTFYTGRANSLFVRRYAGPLQWLNFLAVTVLALPYAFLRELPKGNQAAAVAKGRGVLQGLREELPPPPSPLLSDRRPSPGEPEGAEG